MASCRNSLDVCSYKYQLAQELGPGLYQLTRPDNQSVPILPKDPRYIAQSSGVSISKNTSLIDIDSELIGIGRNLTRCPDRQYMPDGNASFNCGAQTGKVRNGCQPFDKVCVDNSEVLKFADNNLWTEDTKLSNPASTLRGTGFNRWENLPMDPQERVIEEFDFQINSKLLSKDNHRPCLPRPIDQYNVYPTPSNTPICESIVPVQIVPTNPPSTSWARESIISQY